MTRRPGRRTRQRIRASDLLAGLLQQHGIARELREHRILARWRDLVGDTLAERTWPDGLERGVLWVRVKNSSWLHQLSFLRDDLVVRLNHELGDPPLVREIRFHVGARHRIADDDALAPTLRIRRSRPRQRKPPPAATGARLAAIEDEADTIGDAELRAIVLDVRRRWDL
jgi:predicted nucleic acid-binding Zn ribbon protein